MNIGSFFPWAYLVKKNSNSSLQWALLLSNEQKEGEKNQVPDISRLRRTEMPHSCSFLPLFRTFSFLGGRGERHAQSTSGLTVRVSASCFSILTNDMWQQPVKRKTLLFSGTSNGAQVRLDGGLVPPHCLSYKKDYHSPRVERIMIPSPFSSEMKEKELNPYFEGTWKQTSVFSSSFRKAVWESCPLCPRNTETKWTMGGCKCQRTICSSAKSPSRSSTGNKETEKIKLETK